MVRAGEVGRWVLKPVDGNGRRVLGKYVEMDKARQAREHEGEGSIHKEILRQGCPRSYKCDAGCVRASTQHRRTVAEDDDAGGVPVEVGLIHHGAYLASSEEARQGNSTGLASQPVRDKGSIVPRLVEEVAPPAVAGDKQGTERWRLQALRCQEELEVDVDRIQIWLPINRQGAEQTSTLFCPGY